VDYGSKVGKKYGMVQAGYLLLKGTIESNPLGYGEKSEGEVEGVGGIVMGDLGLK